MYNAQDYWEITADHRSYIKDETKQYVPKMIAAALIAKEPEKYGFHGITYQPPLAYEEVTLPAAIELKDVASASGVELSLLVDLNPELKRWITPPGESEYRLRVPPGSKERLMENYAQLIKAKAPARLRPPQSEAGRAFLCHCPQIRGQSRHHCPGQPG